LMRRPNTTARTGPDLSRRDLLKSGIAGGAWLPLFRPASLLAGEVGPAKRGGILRVRGWDPPHFDPHLTRNFMTMTTLSFVYSKLLRHKVGAEVPRGTFAVDPDLAERCEPPGERTSITHLPTLVHWHNNPPVN